MGIEQDQERAQLTTQACSTSIVGVCSPVSVARTDSTDAVCPLIVLTSLWGTSGLDMAAVLPSRDSELLHVVNIS